MEASTARRRSAIAIGACLFVAYAYFYQGGGWNQNSRFALVRAIVEQQTLRVDDTAYFDGRRITGDLANYKGHLYSDKAPGVALAAVPVVAAARTFVEHPASREGIAILSYVATVLTAALPSMLAAVLVFYLAGALGASHGAAVVGALVFGLGSPAWAYATLFYGHALATACLVAAFSAAVALRRFSSRARDRLMATIVGAGGGWATVTEYTAVVPAAIIALLVFLCARSEVPGRRRRVIADLAVAAVACGAVLGLFNVVSFGGPFNLGYTYLVGFQEMAQGSFAFSAPASGVIWALLFGQYPWTVRSGASTGGGAARIRVAGSPSVDASPGHRGVRDHGVLPSAQRLLSLLAWRMVIRSSIHGADPPLHEHWRGDRLVARCAGRPCRSFCTGSLRGRRDLCGGGHHGAAKGRHRTTGGGTALAEFRSWPSGDQLAVVRGRSTRGRTRSVGSRLESR